MIESGRIDGPVREALATGALPDLVHHPMLPPDDRVAPP
jgi:hypothetical protein